MDSTSAVSSYFSGERSEINLSEIFGNTSTSSDASNSTDYSFTYGTSSNSFSEEDSVEEILQSNLNFYQPGCSWNPSDDSDFEDTSYETDMMYELEKQQEKEENLWQQEQLNKERKVKLKRYFDIYKNKMKSIFNLKGIQFTHFNHRFIKFIFTPSAFSKKYICAHRKYYVSLKYHKTWWNLKQMQVPNKSEILEMFKHQINDKELMKVLDEIYKSLVNVTHELIKSRKVKHKKYLMGNEVHFNSDDENLLLNFEERKRRREKINRIWERMLPPNAVSSSLESSY